MSKFKNILVLIFSAFLTLASSSAFAFLVGGSDINLENDPTIITGADNTPTQYQLTVLKTAVFANINRMVYLKDDGYGLAYSNVLNPGDNAHSYCFVIRRNQTSSNLVMNEGLVLLSYQTELYAVPSASDSNQQSGVYVRFQTSEMNYAELGCFVKDAQTLDLATVQQAIRFVAPLIQVQ